MTLARRGSSITGVGVSDLTCAASGLGIVGSVSVALVLVAEGAPIAPPIWGDYDGYGSIEPYSTTTEIVARGVAELVARGALVPGPEYAETPTVRAFLEDVRQGMILQSVGNDALLVRVAGLPIGFVTVLDDIYDAAVKLVRATPEGEDIEELEGDALVARALGVPAVSAAFAPQPLAGATLQLADLALFRHWFDPRGTWHPRYSGDQLSPAELARRVTAAREALGPAFAKAVDAYARRVL